MAETIWPTIHAERQALIDDLTGLSPAQWQTRSLSQRWTVHDVLAHLVAAAKMTPLRFVPGLAGAGFDFHRYMDKLVARGARRRSRGDAGHLPGGPAADLLAAGAAHHLAG